MPEPRALHTCESRSFPPHDGLTDQVVTFAEMIPCGKPATLHQVGGRDYWMCAECAAMTWTPPLG